MLGPGTTLDHDKYRIEAVVGRGGFGYVYRARERLTGATVAIKELVPSFVDDQQVVQRFIQEARTTLSLSHRHILRTYGIFQDHGTYYLAMEYVSGGSMADKLEGEPLSIAEAIRIATELCTALEYAHEEGVVHCDIKPANVLLDERGRVHLTDFGIAHVSAEIMTRQVFTATGVAMGTVRYMSPEQLAGVRADPRIDIYAVGAVLYEMLAGRPYLDFETDGTPRAQARNIVKIEQDSPRPLRAVNPAVPQWLAQVVERALRKAPGQRFASAKDLRDALRGKVQQQHDHQLLAPTQVVVDGEPPLANEWVTDHERLRGMTGNDTQAEERSREPPSGPKLPVVPPDRRSGEGRTDHLRNTPAWGWALGALAAVALLVGGGMWLQRTIGGKPATIPAATSNLRSPSPTRAVATATFLPMSQSVGAPTATLAPMPLPDTSSTTTLSRTPTTRPTITASVTRTSTPSPAPGDTPANTSTPASPPSLSPTPATGGWIRFSSLEYCTRAGCRLLQDGSTISRSEGVIKWEMDLLAPDLNEPNDHGRYYVGREIGLQLVSGDRRGYVQPYPGQNICAEGADETWVVQTFYGGSHRCTGGEVADEVRVDVRNLPDWAGLSVKIAPAAKVSRRDRVDGTWTAAVEAHWELGSEVVIEVSE